MALNPFLLAANTPEPDARLLPLLRENPSLASKQDNHGYSLLHAAASYNHLDLLRILVHEFKVDINLRDEDNETCLFVVETVPAARCLIEELNIDASAQNDDGQSAREKFEADDEYPLIVQYLSQGIAASGELAANGADGPPPLPPNVHLTIGSVTAENEEAINAQEPDPEFRRRIEELAASENFNTAEGQQELRNLIQDAVRDVSHDPQSAQRRRID